MVLTFILCMRILRSRQLSRTQWAKGALLLALPGMLGEALILSDFSETMPRMQLASAGRYGAFLFLLYALVLAVALAMSVRAPSQSESA